jgi:hypothetical protein
MSKVPEVDATFVFQAELQSAYMAGIAKERRRVRKAIGDIRTQTWGVMRYEYYPANLVMDALGGAS